MPLYLNMGMRQLMPSVVSTGAAARIAAQIFFSVVRAGSGTPAI
jgi:hypothetical protein